MGRWIAVTTRVPSRKGMAFEAFIVTDGKNVWTETAHPSWWNFKGRADRNEYRGPKVTHWMRLPTPPKMRRSSTRTHD